LKEVKDKLAAEGLSEEDRSDLKKQEGELHIELSALSDKIDELNRKNDKSRGKLLRTV
jgi:hypothetical protein